MAIHVFVDKNDKSIYFEHLSSGTHFYEMRTTIQDSLENSKRGYRFPVLQKTPDHEAFFSVEEAKALKEEILTILKEKSSINIIPKDSYSIDLNFIISRLKIILKGCDIAIENNGTLGWVY